MRGRRELCLRVARRDCDSTNGCIDCQRDATRVARGRRRFVQIIIIVDAATTAGTAATEQCGHKSHYVEITLAGQLFFALPTLGGEHTASSQHRVSIVP